MTSLEGWGSAIELRPRAAATAQQPTGSLAASAPGRSPVLRAPGHRRARHRARQGRTRHGRLRLGPPGCGAAWLARLLWEQEAASSNLAIPTIIAGQRLRISSESDFQDRLTVLWP